MPVSPHPWHPRLPVVESAAFMPHRFLFASPLLAMPHQHGGCVYPDAVLTALHAAGMTIDYAWLAWPLRRDRVAMRDPLQAGYVDRGYIPGTRRLGGWRYRAPGEWCSHPPAASCEDSGAEPLPTTDEKRFFLELVRRTDPRAVLIDFTTTLPVLDGLLPEEREKLTVAVLTHNDIHRRTQLYRERQLPLDFRPLSRDEEAALLRRADVIVAIQEREAEEFREMVPDREIVVVPMPVKLQTRVSTLDEAPRCLFVGGYSGHNLDGLQWFLSEVWLGVLAAHPEAEFDVVGTVGKAVPSDTPRVRVHGSLSNLEPLYARASVCLVPLRFGTGLKIKLIEAMAHGRAVVSTPAGAEGFPELESGEVVPVAESAAAMASAINRLLSDRSVRREQVARQDAWLQSRFASAVAVRPLVDLFTSSAVPVLV